MVPHKRNKVKKTFVSSTEISAGRFIFLFKNWWRWRELNPRPDILQAYTSTSLVNFF